MLMVSTSNLVFRFLCIKLAFSLALPARSLPFLSVPLDKQPANSTVYCLTDCVHVQHNTTVHVPALNVRGKINSSLHFYWIKVTQQLWFYFELPFCQSHVGKLASIYAFILVSVENVREKEKLRRKFIDRTSDKMICALISCLILFNSAQLV